MNRLTMVGGVLVLSLTAAGCGGGNSSGTQPATDDSLETSTDVTDETPADSIEEVAEIAGKTDFTLLAGETEGDHNAFGYALKGEEITAPGPTIRLRKGEEVTITLRNEHGQFSGGFNLHDLIVVPEKKTTAEVLWGAEIGNVRPGKGDLVTFTPDAAGDFFYVCTLSGHLSIHDMWGRLIIEG